MSHISVPYTIKRGATYYLNLRINGGIYRYSLRTQRSNRALNLVSDIIASLELDELKKMDKGDLDNIVREKVQRYLKLASTLFDENAEHEEQLFTSYQHRRLQIVKQRNLGFNVSPDIPTELESYRDYKINHCLPSKKPKYYVDSIVRNALEKDIGTTIPDFCDLTKDLFDSEERIEVFFKSLEYIKESLLKGAGLQAKAEYEALKASHSNSLKLSEVIDQCMNAGIEGKLSESRSQKVEPWNPKIQSDYRRTLGFLNIYFKDRFIIDITRKELDDFMTNIVINHPSSNRKPYNRFSTEEILNSILKGEVEAEETIQNKTVTHIYKKIRTLWRFYSLQLGGEDVSKQMHFKPSDSNVRGRFSKTQVRKIISFVDDLNEGKKWPINIMAHSGLRNSEVMQLRKVDIKKNEDNIWYFDINKEAGPLKTDNAVRVVPIHKNLIKKGFIEFVENSSDEYLFKRFSSSPKYLTRLFSNHIRPNCDIPLKNESGNLLSLYSLRHFIISALAENKVDTAYIQALSGHSSTSDNRGITANYIHADSMELKQKYIDEIEVG